MPNRPLLFLLLNLLPASVLAVACADIFSNAVGTTGGTLKLDNQPRLDNTRDRILATDDLSASGKNANKVCDNSACIASGTPAASAALPGNSSSTDFDNSVPSFAAGDYFFKDFTLSGGASTELMVTSGTVRIHVSGKLVIDGARANFGGAPEDLVFLVGGDVELKGKAKVNALFYSEGSVVITDNATQIEGAVTGFSVEVKDKARVTFDGDAVAMADFGGFCTGAAGGTVDADGFNCVVNGADALTGHLYLQKVGAPFGFDVVALRDSDANGTMDAVETAFAADADRTVTVELVDASGGAACASRPALIPAVSQALSFTAADAGRKVVAPVVVNRVYRTVGCRVTDATSMPALVACSTDTFTARPTALTLNTPVLSNAGASGTPRAAAGASFGLAVAGGVGYDGTPQIDASRIVAHASAVQTGTLAGGFAAADIATGVATGSGFSYSEVGNFRFVPQGLYDSGFAGDDAANGDCTADFSNTAVGGRYGCLFGNTTDSAWVGRFHPTDLQVSTQFAGALDNSCMPGGFSYQGQQVALATGTVFRVTARNGSGVTTRNYTGVYAKLGASDFTFGAVASDGTQLGADGINKVTAIWSTPGSRILSDNGDGSLDLALSGAGFTWGRVINDRVGPFTTDLDISLTALNDADGVGGVGLPEVASPGGVDMRYGRVALTNAHGSELQNLRIPMRVEYYAGAGTGFVANTLDSCSNVLSIAFVDLNAGDGLAVSETCVWDVDNDSGLGCAGAGPGGSEFEPVSVAGAFNLYLKAPGADNSGVIEVGADVPSHLEYDWLGSGDDDPAARATFGIFNRPSSIIYRREVR